MSFGQLTCCCNPPVPICEYATPQAEASTDHASPIPNTGGSTDWSDMTNVETIDTNYAYAVLTSAQADDPTKDSGRTTDYLDCTDFGLAIPTTATLTQILFECEVQLADYYGYGPFNVGNVDLDLAQIGTTHGGGTANYSIVGGLFDAYSRARVFGVSSPAPITEIPANVNDSSYGVRISAENAGVTGGLDDNSGGEIRVNWVRLTVCYTLP